MSVLNSTPNIARGRPTNANEVGTVAAVAGLSVKEYGESIGLRQTQLTFTNVKQVFTDATGNIYYGGTKVYTFPTSSLLILGTVTSLAIARVGALLPATASVVGSIGTATAAADATLTSTEADIVASTAATLTSGAGTMYNAPSATLSIAASTSATAKDVYLNWAASATSGGTDALTINGTVTITWVALGSR